MSFEQMKSVAAELTSALQPLSNQDIHVCAHAFSQDSRFPDRIVIEGIKCLNKTGRFLNSDRKQVDDIIYRVCSPYSCKIKVLAADPCMHNAIIMAL